MELKDIEAFLLVASTGSFSEAAEELGIGQPTVTKYILRLEQLLGGQLLNRDMRPIKLTPLGVDFLNVSAPLVSGLQTFRQSRHRDNSETPFIVACAHGFANELFLRAIQSFRQIYQHTPVKVRIGTKPEVLSWVRQKTVDACIIPNPDTLEDLSFFPLAASERILITPQDHPLLRQSRFELESIAAFPLILLGHQTRTRTLLEQAFEQRGIRYEVALELDSMDSVKRFVELGLGIGVGHSMALDPDRDSQLGIVSLSEFLPSELIGVATIKGRPLSGPTASFVKEIQNSSHDLRRSLKNPALNGNLRSSKSI